MGIFNLKSLMEAKELKKETFIINKTKDQYNIKNNNGDIISKLNFYDYNIKDFDWVLIANVETKSDYRGRGLATKLINRLYADIAKTTKGIYLFVKHDNKNAISLYKKLNFKTIKNYKLNGVDYIIMAKGNADIDQFKNRKFS